MKVIKDHIKSGSFKPFYLLYGSESYLKKLYRDKLKTAILGDSDDMNFNYFEGKDVDQKKINEIAQTLPFFRDKRLIIIENSGLFKSQSELSDQLIHMPDSTILLFIEEEVDKRSKMFKTVRDLGTIAEMNGLDEKNLKLFVVSLLEQEGKRIAESTINYFLEKTGPDMANIKNEVDKLVGYIWDRAIVTPEDVDAVVTTQITGKIFNMIDAIGSKQQNKALELYYDLLSLREKPMSILFLITKHFNTLLQVKDLFRRGSNPSSISEMVGIPPFAVNKYIGQAKNFSSGHLKDALEFAADMEEQIKTGRMIDKIGVELLIITFSTRKIS
ncbi:DNA polymerase III subunit delta [Mobilitalea sibirica]|uniref:DNA polymerase III subunit delta n=1 Tax=Mobilitalea sibirica TaxID=1462919 RepID=A0A8J7KTI5_9FIRM|nr:DNA polymerase III subunit delta [Mobilitalea sibirica]MBH1941421.1 DNA polymerase III subunit delta [Mobilitalea sibirica]